MSVTYIYILKMVVKIVMIFFVSEIERSFRQFVTEKNKICFRQNPNDEKIHRQTHKPFTRT